MSVQWNKCVCQPNEINVSLSNHEHLFQVDLEGLGLFDHYLKKVVLEEIFSTETTDHSLEILYYIYYTSDRFILVQMVAFWI